MVISWPARAPSIAARTDGSNAAHVADDLVGGERTHDRGRVPFGDDRGGQADRGARVARAGSTRMLSAGTAGSWRATAVACADAGDDHRRLRRASPPSRSTVACSSDAGVPVSGVQELRMTGAGQRPEPRAAAARRNDRVEHLAIMPDAQRCGKRAGLCGTRARRRARLSAARHPPLVAALLGHRGRRPTGSAAAGWPLVHAAQAARCTSALHVPGELLGPGQPGRGQRVAARLVVEQRGEVAGDLVGRRDRCRRPPRHRPRATTAAAWSAPVRRTPSLPGSAGRSPRRTTGTPRRARRRGSRAGRRSAGSPGAAGAGAAGTSTTAWSISSSWPGAAGDDERRRVGPVAHGQHPAPDQARHVLARLLGAEERDVPGAAEAEPGPHPGLLLLGRHVERRRVDAVVRHVDAGRVGVEQPDQLVAGRLARHDHPAGPAHRRLDRRPEERAPGLVVVLRLGEERRVVHGDRHRAGRSATGRCRTASAAPRRRPAGPAAAGRSAPRPAGPGRWATAAGAATHPARRQLPGVPLGVGALAHHREVDVRSVPSAPSRPST